MKINQIKLTLKKLLMQFGEIETSNGKLEFAGEELVVGAEVFIDDEPAPSGDYETEAQIIVVENGIVTEIKEKEVPQEEAPEAPVEEVEVAAEEENPTVEEVVEEVTEPSLEDSLVEILAPITESVKSLKAEMETIKGRLDQIEEKLLADAAKPAEEEFKEIKKTSGFWGK